MEDEGVVSSCCMDDPDAADHDPDSFDCETCKTRMLREQLGPDDERAMEVYGVLADPVVKDLGVYPLAWAAVGLRVTRTQAVELLDKLSRLHQHTRTMAELKADQDKGSDPVERSSIT